MKKPLHLCLLLIFLVMITGCSLFGGAEPEESGQAKAEADRPTPPAMEILQNAEESMMDIKGVRYDVAGDQNLRLAQDGKMETASMDFNAGLHLARDPFGIHLKGYMNTDTDTVPMETYLSEGVWYNRMDQGDWMRTKGPSFGEGQGQTPLPTESLKQLRLVLEKQSNGGEGVRMTAEEESYVLEMNLSEEGLKKQLGDDYKKIRKELEPSWAEIGLPLADRDARLVQVNRRISVDKETFMPTQIDHLTVWEIPLEKGSVTLEQNMIMSYAGESTESVTVPQEVKENARDR
ncbi:DUF6612 family protein [Desmospora profundinema]|uniref:Lipoprotein n=1 Tax=Desmospora profundinema TaxID=1571184 RepID=A0ABU1IQB3_9BACL|nr:DUF6612 family protein [Desmospora profundinema]MDR6225940.1 hypothetical protein [Desmospora profundinema]